MRLRYLLPFLVLVLAGCGPATAGPPETPTAQSGWEPPLSHLANQAAAHGTPAPAALDLALTEKDVKMQPLPVRAGIPFTITATIHNRSVVTAERVPVLVYLSSAQEQLSFTPFMAVLTTTVPATRTATVRVPVVWNLSGGEHRLWVRVNNLPQAWQADTPILPEARLADNSVLIELTVEPFDAYSSDVCAGRVDVAVGDQDVRLMPDRQHVGVRVHNLGNQAVYNLAVVASAGQGRGIAYTPAIPPCGGTSDVVVSLPGPLQAGGSFRVEVNPAGWPDGLAEDDLDNNQVAAAAGLAETTAGPLPQVVDYDFSLGPADVDVSQQGIVLLTVHNLGTRDAARVPVRIEAKSGRKLTDVIPVVEGGGLGVVAIQVGGLWTAGGTLTITVNPPGIKGGYPEADRQNNSVAVTLPKKK